MQPQPGLFGLIHTNKDFNNRAAWGKNVFNNTFPTALACFMDSISLPLVYLKFQQGALLHEPMSASDIFGLPCLSESLYFAFERDYGPYQTMIIGNLPRNDLVTFDSVNERFLRHLEIKLTAIPDDSTDELAPELFGAELVIRPDTIVYLALSIAKLFQHQREKLMPYVQAFDAITQWETVTDVLAYIPTMADSLDQLMHDYVAYQTPLLMQAIWRTQGKSLQFHPSTFDVFIWSNFAFTRLFFRERYQVITSRGGLSRGTRTIVWLTKMLYDFAHTGHFDAAQITDSLSYGTRNDKAFSVNGRITQPLIDSVYLHQPRVSYQQLNQIILGDGQRLLSPERRLDAAILATPDIF